MHSTLPEILFRQILWPTSVTTLLSGQLQIYSFIFTPFATICFILYVYFRLLFQFLCSSWQRFSCETTTFPNRLSYNAATPLHPSHSSTFHGRILTNFYATFTTLNVVVDFYSCLPAGETAARNSSPILRTENEESLEQTEKRHFRLSIRFSFFSSYLLFPSISRPFFFFLFFSFLFSIN